jgi:hypothetical protein
LAGSAVQAPAPVSNSFAHGDGRRSGRELPSRELWRKTAPLRFAHACPWTCQNSSQSRRRKIAPPPPKPRGGRRALAGGEEQASGLLAVTTHTLCWREKSSAKCATVLLNWPPPDQLWKILAMSAMRLDERTPAEIPGTRLELRPPTAEAQTRIVSGARIRQDPRKSARPFKGIICGDVSEFESHMPSHAVRSPPAKMWTRNPPSLVFVVFESRPPMPAPRLTA